MHGAGYGRAKVVNGLLFGSLGLVIAYRSLAVAGLGLRALPGIILGLAMIALAVVRFRNYAASRRM